MVASTAFADFLRELLAPRGHVSLRRMFGKTGVFCDGVMLGMVTDNTLYLRVDNENQATFQEAPHTARATDPAASGATRMHKPGRTATVHTNCSSPIEETHS